MVNTVQLYMDDNIIVEDYVDLLKKLNFKRLIYPF